MSQTARKTFDPTTLNKPGEFITWFDDLGTGNEEYRFLSNFYQGSPIFVPGWAWEGLFPDEVTRTLRFQGVQDSEGGASQVLTGGIPFLTGEHAFAAMKTRDFQQFYGIVSARGPQEAKTGGRMCSLRPDWEEVKYDVMYAVTRAKYTLNREEGQMLLDTGDALLVEGTFWGDTVWGVALDHPKTGAILSREERPGRNWLGSILMTRRAELRAEQKFGISHPTGEFNAVWSS